MQFLTIRFNPVEVRLDLHESTDPYRYLFGTGEAGAADLERVFSEQLQDAVIDAIALVINQWNPDHADFTVRVQQPQVPVVPLVADIGSEPF